MNRIALITGANKGIGLETARQLGGKNTTILLGARDEAKGNEAATKLRDEGLDVHFIKIDVSNADSIAAAAKEVESRFGRLDILINNAGLNVDFANGATPTTVSSADLRSTFETNFFGAISTIQAFLPLLRKSQAGRIVNVSSTLGSLTTLSDPAAPYYSINLLAYNSSKTALNAATVAIAKELKDTPIKVNSACPGWVKTDMGGDAAPRTVDQGATIIVDLATLGPDGPTGGFFDENGPIAW